MKLVISIFGLIIFASCTLPKHLQTKKFLNNIVNDSALGNGHLGVCVYDVAANKYIALHNANRYFVPASNVKLFTCYTALKTFGDSLPAAYIACNGEVFPLAEPTLLSRDFKTHPLLNYFKQQDTLVLNFSKALQFNKYGKGWPWDDTEAQYMVERNLLPMYNNYGNFNSMGMLLNCYPTYLTNNIVNTAANAANKGIADIVYNNLTEQNNYQIKYSTKVINKKMEIPFTANNQNLVLNMLKDTLKNNQIFISTTNIKPKIIKTIYSQPTDSVLKIMMHRSDNFYAEQLLLLCSAVSLDTLINERAMISNIKKTQLNAFTDDPIWVDGSGLSRYNMFTPQNFVALLLKMNNEIGMPRLKTILPTGGTGTLSSLYLKIPQKIFAKTGTLTGHCALSGYLYTKLGKQLIFSLLADNYTASAGQIRKQFEKFIMHLYSSY